MSLAIAEELFHARVAAGPAGWGTVVEAVASVLALEIEDELEIVEDEALVEFVAPIEGVPDLRYFVAEFSRRLALRPADETLPGFEARLIMTARWRPRRELVDAAPALVAGDPGTQSTAGGQASVERFVEQVAAVPVSAVLNRSDGDFIGVSTELEPPTPVG